MRIRYRSPALLVFVLSVMCAHQVAIAGTVEGLSGAPVAAPAASGTVALSPQPAQRAIAISAIVVNAPSAVNSAEGAFVTITATAASGNPNSIITISATGAPPGLVFTTNTPTAINPTATISGSLGFQTAGAWFILWSAHDQFGETDSAFTQLLVANTNRAPTLVQPSAMFVDEGSFVEQGLSATDQDGDPIFFSLESGPSFVSVSTNVPGNGSAFGTVALFPGFSDAGTYTATIRASDSQASDLKSFTIVVNDVAQNQPPFMDQPGDMVVDEGAIADQQLRATDSDGDPLTFSLSFGPLFTTVTTTNPGSGIATGNVRLTPGPNDAGNYFVGVNVTDGIFFDGRSFSVTVINVPQPPIPGQPVWETAAEFLDPRTGAGVEAPAANLIGDKIYVSHGYRFGDSRLLSIYDIPSDTWTHGGPTAPDAVVFRSEMAGGTALGKHYAIGGRTGPNANLEEFDPATGLWRSRAPMSLARGGLGAASWNNKIYAVGGRNGSTYGSGTIYDRNEVYDPVADRWTTLAPMPRAVSDNYATVAYAGRVYVFGGNDGFQDRAELQIYDIASNRWSSGAPMPTPRGAAMAGVIGDKIAVFGGYNGQNLSITELYDPANGTWTAGPEMVLPASEFAQGVTFDERGIYAIGSGIFGVSGRVVQVLRPLIRLEAPAAQTVDEGQALSFAVTATHRNGLAVTLSAMGTPPGASFTDNGDGTGTFAWTPGFDQAGIHTLVFRGTDGQGAVATKTTLITVRNRNRPPSANAGGPYTSIVGVPIAFNAGGSSDPDGDALAFAWVFGDGGTATGPTPSHTYTAAGTFGVALTVSDGQASDLVTTTASIVSLFQARAFTLGGNPQIRLSSGKPSWCAQVEPIGHAFDVSMVNLSSIVMRSPGTGSVSEIPAMGNKTSVGGDRDGNGLDEISACFTKDDLRRLFADVNGNTTVTVTIEGALFGGGLFRALLDVAVKGSGGGLAATISPNPLNPEAVLTFVTPLPGAARVRVFDSSGRLVGTLLNEATLPAGYHDLRIDGRDGAGRRLASGVYFYRIETPRGSIGGRFAVLK